MKIGVKITILGATAMAALLICAFVGYNSTDTVGKMFIFAGDVYIKSNFAAADIAKSLTQVTQLNALYYHHRSNDAKLQELDQQISELGVTMQKSVLYLRENICDADRPLFEEFERKLQASGAARAKLNDLVAARKWEEYLLYRVGEYQTLVDATIAASMVLEASTAAMALRYCYETSVEEVIKTEMELVTVAAIALIILVALSIIIIMGITKPLKKAVAAAESVAQGNLDVDLSTNSKDETGMLLHSFEKMVHYIKDMIRDINALVAAAKAGDLSKRANTSNSEGDWVMIMSGLNAIVEASEQIINDAGNTLSIMATGDLTPRITKDYSGKFGEMRNSINNLGDSLTDLITQLTEAIHTTAAASAEISSTTDTLAAGTQETSSQADEVATAMEEMAKTVTNNAHSAAKTANVAKHSGEIANNGGNVVQQTIDKMRDIAAVVQTSAENIAKLGESSKKIGEIISVIDDIAGQTNLLSLNAAIEAARAGEQGRGFAVVADSVGKLAISTAGATKEITQMIKDIQEETASAVKAMERGTLEVQSGIELADNAGTSIQDILTGIKELLGMVNEIASACEQQSATSEQISHNVSSISKVVADSAHSIEGVATTANELARMTESLSSIVSQFKVDIHMGMNKMPRMEHNHYDDHHRYNNHHNNHHKPQHSIKNHGSKYLEYH